MAPNVTFISFGIAGEGQYVRGFEAMAHEVEDLSEPLAKVGRELLGSIHEQYRTEGEHGHYGRWKPLSPNYERWKRGQVGDQPILVFTGRTRAEMLKQSAVSVTPRRMTYEPDVPDYAPGHQVGEGRLPQRRMVDLPRSDRRQWDRIFHQFINDLRHGYIPGSGA